MSTVEQMLYNIQKFQILSLFANDSANRTVSPAYAFAWDKNLFPVGSHGCDWHDAHEACFKIRKTQVDELAEFLDDLEREGKTISFYQLEDHYDVRSGSTWDRMDLVFVCRYFRLDGWFSEEFWKGMAGHSDCPSESHSILQDYEAKDVHFE
ncbi:hypothetical protein [Pseudomonas sp. W5-01]|uniref:hypothetical protein n=1 Tax=Pseudomonas sp. W5-01 TaxID=3097454 RepID=UPI003979854C